MIKLSMFYRWLLNRHIVCMWFLSPFTGPVFVGSCYFITILHFTDSFIAMSGTFFVALIYWTLSSYLDHLYNEMCCVKCGTLFTRQDYMDRNVTFSPAYVATNEDISAHLHCAFKEHIKCPVIGVKNGFCGQNDGRA